MTALSYTQKRIILDMTATKKEQQLQRQQRWNGYNIAIIKDKETALDKLHEVLLKRKIHNKMLGKY